MVGVVYYGIVNFKKDGLMTRLKTKKLLSIIAKTAVLLNNSHSIKEYKSIYLDRPKKKYYKNITNGVYDTFILTWGAIAP